MAVLFSFGLVLAASKCAFGMLSCSHAAAAVFEVLLDNSGANGEPQRSKTSDGSSHNLQAVTQRLHAEGRATQKEALLRRHARWAAQYAQDALLTGVPLPLTGHILARIHLHV